MLRGHQLKRLRMVKGLRQEDVAKALDVKRNYISMLENEIQAININRYHQWVNFLNSDKAREIAKRNIEKKVDKSKK